MTEAHKTWAAHEGPTVRQWCDATWYDLDELLIYKSSSGEWVPDPDDSYLDAHITQVDTYGGVDHITVER